MTPAELETEMLRLSHLIDKGVTAINAAAREYAEREAEYRKAKAVAWVTVKAEAAGKPEKALAKDLEVQVDAATADLRRARDIAEGARQSALEAIRSRRAQLSAFQTLANGYRAEADFNRTAP